MSTLLKTEHLKKYYGKKKIVKAVDDVSLEIHAGSSMALIGESGSGKTTFGKLIAGLEKPTDGKFWFQGQEMQVCLKSSFVHIANESSGWSFKAAAGYLIPVIPLEKIFWKF